QRLPAGARLQPPDERIAHRHFDAALEADKRPPIAVPGVRDQVSTASRASLEVDVHLGAPQSRRVCDLFRSIIRVPRRRLIERTEGYARGFGRSADLRLSAEASII